RWAEEAKVKGRTKGRVTIRGAKEEGSKATGRTDGKNGGQQWRCIAWASADLAAGARGRRRGRR
ncbi:MAG TPA: hypothetical protein P5168_05370, partial [Candidatus Methanomethylicus sp.]|nr:hypothetical protein [Candidatus Methanomethylicus sp.]